MAVDPRPGPHRSVPSASTAPTRCRTETSSGDVPSRMALASRLSLSCAARRWTKKISSGFGRSTAPNLSFYSNKLYRIHMLKLDCISCCLHVVGMTHDLYEFRMNMCANQKMGAILYDYQFWQQSENNYRKLKKAQKLKSFCMETFYVQWLVRKMINWQYHQ